MIVELISVGTELLLGNIVNTNAAYLAEKCAGIGLSCYYQSVVGDNVLRLSETLTTAMGRADVVILSGGLGPTQDDITREAAAGVCGRELEMDEHSRERIRQYFTCRRLEITDNNWKQALVPSGAIVVDNDNGTAPGIILEHGEKRLVLLPGPPNELIPMFENSIIPYLYELEPGTIYSKTVKICGIGESKVESMIQDILETQDNPTIAPYAKTGEVHLRITAGAEDEKEAKRLVRPVIRELKARFGRDIYSTEDDSSLEKAVVNLLLANDLTITTVESCTGGLVAARLINVPGVSKSYKTGYITYSNKAKRKCAGVNKGTLKKHGAVSAEVAREMARGAAMLTKSDVTIAVTGIAGPDGGTDEKPAGLVYIACCVCGTTAVREFRFQGNRGKIRESAVSAALILTRSCILEYESRATSGK